MPKSTGGASVEKLGARLGGRTIHYIVICLSSRTGYVHGDLSGQSWQFLIFHGVAKYLHFLTAEEGKSS